MRRPIVSVIICTFNPRQDYIVRVLDGLRAQTLGVSDWELIVIDNNSTPLLCERIDLSWHPSSRIVRESAQGLTPARLRGIREACAEILVFVDDDNVLNEYFLETTHRIAEEHVFLGSWSGQCHPEFERTPPEWTRRYWGNLVIREFKGDQWSNLPRLGATMPCGAGLTVRRDVARHYLALHDDGARPVQLDRAGNSLLSAGDNDLAACSCDLGIGQGIFDRLELTHLIPSERLSEDYLKRLLEAIYFSAVVIARLRNEESEVSAYRVRVRDKLKALFLPSPHRQMALAELRGRCRGLDFISEHLPSDTGMRAGGRIVNGYCRT